MIEHSNLDEPFEQTVVINKERKKMNERQLSHLGREKDDIENIEDNEKIEQNIIEKDAVVKTTPPISHTESRELSIFIKGSIKTACTDDEDVFDRLDEDDLIEPNLKEKKFKQGKVKSTKEMKAELHLIPKVVEANHKKENHVRHLARRVKAHEKLLLHAYTTLSIPSNKGIKNKLNKLSA